MRRTNGFIAVDWGTTRFRAHLVNSEGHIIESIAVPQGISAVANKDFHRVFQQHCAAWLEREGDAPVIMAGMIGSRNGWKEVPYVSCPASLGDLAENISAVSIASSRNAFIVPGVICREDGVPDVMRGEETLVFGANIHNGTIVVPGTHSKWIKVVNGEIVAFRTYLTGELYGLLRHHSVLGLLAGEPEDASSFVRGVNSSHRSGGLLHQVFEARTAVLEGSMMSSQVGPFISGLLIASELNSAMHLFKDELPIAIVAEGELATNYVKAFERHAKKFTVLMPHATLVMGLGRILDALR